MINKEDKADVARHLGKALAKKVSKVTDDSRMRGQMQKKYENEANPEMHAFKNSMRRKGFSDGKIFSGALRQAERYNKKGMSKETMDAAQKGDKGAFVRSFMK